MLSRLRLLFHDVFIPWLITVVWSRRWLTWLFSHPISFFRIQGRLSAFVGLDWNPFASELRFDFLYRPWLKYAITFSDKLKKGKRDGTPDKPNTPIASQDALLEEGANQPDKKSVLINDEILGLQIKPEDLQKVLFNPTDFIYF